MKMNSKKNLVLAAILSTVSVSAMAESPSFDYIQGGYVSWDFDGISGNFDGFQVSVKKTIHQDFYFTGDFQSISQSSIDTTIGTFGVGYKQNISDSTALFGQLEYASVSVDVGGFFGSADSNGYQASAGIKGMVSPQVELTGAVEYLNLDVDNTTTFVGKAAYNINKEIAIYADIKLEKDSTTYGIGARYNF